MNTTYPYLIIGGGSAADKAARAIKKREPDAQTGMISQSQRGPVYRPSLSKDLWIKDDATLDGEELGTEEFAEIITGTTVASISPDDHLVTLADGTDVSYGKLLIATGASPRTFPGADTDGVFTFRTAEDYEALRAAVGEGTTVAIIGGGYIATELAAGLSENGAKVSVSFPGERLLEHMLPSGLTEIVTATYEEHDVQLNPGRRLTKIAPGPTLTFDDGVQEQADVVILGLGATLNTDLAEAAGLEFTDGAISVDQHMATSAPDVFAAGDIVTYPDARLGCRRVEHVDHAEKSGALAGANMVEGESANDYDYTPFFWSDMFDLGYEAIGELDTSHPTLERYNEDRSSAVVYYLSEDDEVRGVLLWNTWGQVKTARDLLGHPQPSDLAGVIAPGG